MGKCDKIITEALTVASHRLQSGDQEYGRVECERQAPDCGDHLVGVTLSLPFARLQWSADSEVSLQGYCH